MFRELGIPRFAIDEHISQFTEYELFEEDKEKLFSAQLQPSMLDPITVGAAANMITLIEHMKRADLPGSWKAIEFFEGSLVIDLPAHSELITSPHSYSNSLEILSGSGVFTPIGTLADKAFSNSNWKVERCWAKYFEILKTLETTRAILDCRQANVLWPKPPTFLLVSMEEIRRITTFFPHPAMAACDLRHFFYQLSIPPRYRRFFSVKERQTIYEPLVLPMGFSWAPFLAQQTAMSMAIIKEDNLYSCIPPCPEGTMPPFLTFRNIRGKTVAFVIVWYDNYLIVAINITVRNQLRRGIDANLRRAKIVIKKQKFSDRSEQVDSDDCGMVEWIETHDASTRVEFNGMIIDVSDGVSVSHRAGNIENWTRIQHLLLAEVPARAIAAAVGIIVWHDQVHDVALAADVHAINALRTVSVGRNTRKHWRELVPGLEAERNLLHKRMETIIRNEPVRWTPPQIYERRLIIATDASTVGQGGVVLDEKGSILDWWSLPARCAPEDIWKSEIQALVRCIKWIEDKAWNVYIGCEVWAAMDSTIALSSFQRRYSPDVVMSESILRTLQRVQSWGSSLRTTYVNTLRLVADNPSRLEPPCQVKAAETWDDVSRAVLRSLELSAARRKYGRDCK